MSHIDSLARHTGNSPTVSLTFLIRTSTVTLAHLARTPFTVSLAPLACMSHTVTLAQVSVRYLEWQQPDYVRIPRGSFWNAFSLIPALVSVF